MDLEKDICESATGIRQSTTIGKFYNDRGDVISVNEAKRLFREGGVVEVPNAGAGSFREVLKRLGYRKIEVYEWTSSAGDWTFRIRGHYVCQENRYPYHGFRYAIAEVY